MDWTVTHFVNRLLTHRIPSLLSKFLREWIKVNLFWYQQQNISKTRFLSRARQSSLRIPPRMKFQAFVCILSALLTQVLCQTSVELGPEDPAQLFTVQIRNFSFPALENATFLCTGTIIDLRHVVTAASCVLRNSNDMIVVYGSVNKTWTAESGNFEYLEWVQIHPQFQDNNPRANNIAVLRVSRTWF